MGINSVKYVKANVSINMNGEAKLGFSVEGKNYKLELPDFDTEFHDFDLVNDDLDGSHFAGVLDSEKIVSLYEYDPSSPDLSDLISKLS